MFVWRRVESGCGLDAGWRRTRDVCFVFLVLFYLQAPQKMFTCFECSKTLYDPALLQMLRLSFRRFKARLPKFQFHSYWSAVMTIAKLCGLLNKAVTWSHDRTTTCCFYPWACWHHSRANVGLDGVICHLFCCWQHKQEEVDENRFVWDVSLLKAQLAC